MSKPYDYSGQVVLVTGGTKGIGKTIAEAFLAAGGTVVVCGRNAPEALPSANGRQADFLPLDVKDPEAVQSFFHAFKERYGRLDVLVNNAGGAPPVDSATVSPRFHESIIRLNLIAPLHIAQLANAIMQQQKSGGTIIFMGSIAAHRPSPGVAAYSAAKAGILQLVKALAFEWAPKVRPVSISPGLVRTEETDRLYSGDEAGVQAINATIPLGRMAWPQDIANACLYLASSDAGYISGIDLLVHGGGEKPAYLEAWGAEKS
ncbi:MAG: SDR family oxidoreductase [Proteobacteria bacterium]|nr:SDR family oxidoreductase [Pseudomonadota bacterium]HQR02562.1 SDR family oxidoreductase [Rhodocyclaceae bacterium]